jgi:hypothetical protein
MVTSLARGVALVLVQLPRTVQSAPPEPSRGGSTLVLIGLLAVVVIVVLWIVFRQARSRRISHEQPHPPGQRAGPPLDQAGPSFVISPDAARAGARRGFAEYGLLARPRWAALLSAPSVERAPLLVRRLDVTDPARTYYYLVPVGPNDYTIGVAARVNGVSGKLIGCKAVVPGGKKPWGLMIADYRTDDETPSSIASRTPVVSGEPIAPDVRGIGIHPALVWKPCVESRSPYYPFRLVTVGGRTKYVRIDGKEFESLTPLGPSPGYDTSLSKLDGGADYSSRTRD